MAGSSFPGIVFNEDGFSVTRTNSVPEGAASSDPVAGVSSKDVVLDEISGLSVRAYFPVDGLGRQRLPLLVYFHGGGFILFSAKSVPFHMFAEDLARRLKAVVISVDYRLAPEHRLPAAYEDGTSVLAWLEMLSKQASTSVIEDILSTSNFGEWLKYHGDFSNVFLAGDSAGGNIAYHVGRNWSKSSKFLALVGLVLIQPFFGGMHRTESDIKCSEGPVLTLDTNDICWKYGLPLGADRDHPFCNFYKNLEGVEELPRVMVIAGGLDLLHDRQVELVKLLQQKKREVTLVEYDNVGHAFYMVPGSPEISLFFNDLATFLKKCIYS